MSLGRREDNDMLYQAMRAYGVTARGEEGVAMSVQWWRNFLLTTFIEYDIIYAIFYFSHFVQL